MEKKCIHVRENFWMDLSLSPVLHCRAGTAILLIPLHCEWFEFSVLRYLIFGCLLFICLFGFLVI